MAGQRSRLLWVALVLALVLATAVTLALVVADRLAGPDGAEVVPSSSAPSGWKTIDYRGVRVDIPADWERSDQDDCEFALEHWGPPEPGGCDRDEGVAFYYSATFDPARGPGVRRADPRDRTSAAWAGWIDAGGEYDVYASATRRGVVATVLTSVRSGSGRSGRPGRSGATAR